LLCLLGVPLLRDDASVRTVLKMAVTTTRDQSNELKGKYLRGDLIAFKAFLCATILRLAVITAPHSHVKTLPII
jgi:hypothetical protein